MSRFQKGQIVYSASVNFSTYGQHAMRDANGKFQGWAAGPKTREGREITIGAVIERQIDACGKKQISFYDRGDNDFVFGRRMSADTPRLFTTADEAFEYVKQHCDLVVADVYSDANRNIFNDNAAGKLKFK